MAHATTETNLSPAEKEFKELMHQGDDFFKIELLRKAQEKYHAALVYNMETETVQHKIAECKRLLASERKVVFILLGIATVALLAWIVLGN